LSIGQNYSIQDMHCNVRVDGKTNHSQINTVRIESGNDYDIFYQWVIQVNQLWANSYNRFKFLGLSFNYIHHLIINFGAGGSSVEFGKGNVVTETVLNFPQSLTNKNTTRNWK